MIHSLSLFWYDSHDDSTKSLFVTYGTAVNSLLATTALTMINLYALWIDNQYFNARVYKSI